MKSVHGVGPVHHVATPGPTIYLPPTFDMNFNELGRPVCNGPIGHGQCNEPSSISVGPKWSDQLTTAIAVGNYILELAS